MTSSLCCWSHGVTCQFWVSLRHWPTLNAAGAPAVLVLDVGPEDGLVDDELVSEVGAADDVVVCGGGVTAGELLPRTR
ncbi:hypothetical protein ACFQDH_11525 [Flexivirga alba]|uniref:Uncharacterized protein n=1 Tax=Flexivirga alba TaxID=702742 RepID=A0ABW2AGG0_9MICO